MAHNTRVLVAVLSSTLLASGCEKDAPQAKPTPRPVKYQVVGASGASSARSLSGSIIARDATQLSFRVGGNLATLAVKMGDQVKKNQVIGKLDDSDYQVALSQAQANYQSAKTQRDTAQSTFNRVEKLFESGSSSQADYEAAKGNLRAAQAQLSASGQAVKQARNQREYAVLKTPFAGVINTVSAKVGESVGAGQPIVVVSRGGELEVSVGVPESMIAEVKVGTPAQVRVSSLGDVVLAGKVREVGFASESSTYPVRVALDKAFDTLRPGMAANAEFEFGKKQAALSIAASGVGNVEDGSFVYVLDAAEGELFKIRRAKVVLGELMGDRYEIKSGVSAGDRVAVAGLGSLVDGMTVRLLGGEQNTADKAPVGDKK